MHDVEHAGNGSDLRDPERRADTRDDLPPIEHNFEPAWEALPLVADSVGAKEGYEEGTKLMGDPAWSAYREDHPIPAVLRAGISDPATSEERRGPAKHSGPSRWD